MCALIHKVVGKCAPSRVAIQVPTRRKHGEGVIVLTHNFVFNNTKVKKHFSFVTIKITKKNHENSKSSKLFLNYYSRLNVCPTCTRVY